MKQLKVYGVVATYPSGNKAVLYAEVSRKAILRRSGYERDWHRSDRPSRRPTFRVVEFYPRDAA